MQNKIFRKGFTLIELLIVITIIGILAVSFLPSIIGAPAKARDAARIAGLNNIVTAIATYNADKGDYPPTGGGYCLPDLKEYFPGGVVPNDPQQSGFGVGCNNGYTYCKLGGDANYLVAAKMEGTDTVNTNFATPTDITSLCTANGDAPALTPNTGSLYVIIK